MLRQRLAIVAATPNLIPTPAAHLPLGRSTHQIAGRSSFRPHDNTPSHAANPHRPRRRNRAPSGPRFRALALLGRLSSERVDSLVMQASEKPAQNRTRRRVPRIWLLGCTPQLRAAPTDIACAESGLLPALVELIADASRLPLATWR